MKMKKYWIVVAILGICAGAVLAAIRSAGEIATNKQIVRLMTMDPNYLESGTWQNMKQQTLTRLNAIGLVIYKSHSSYNPLKVTRFVETGALKAMVANKLEIAGIRVLSNNELLLEPGSPLLVVCIDTSGPTYKDYYKTEEGKVIGTSLGYKGICSVSIWQEEFLVREKDISHYGITWSGDVIVSKWADTRDELEESIKNTTEQALNYFIVAHLAFNPKSVDIGQK